MLFIAHYLIPFLSTGWSGLVPIALNTILLKINVRRIYIDIMKGKNCCQFSLLTWNSFMGQFVHPVVWEESG